MKNYRWLWAWIKHFGYCIKGKIHERTMQQARFPYQVGECKSKQLSDFIILQSDRTTNNKCWRKLRKEGSLEKHNPHSLLTELQTCEATMKISVKNYQKIKNKSIIRPRCTAPWHIAKGSHILHHKYWLSHVLC